MAKTSVISLRTPIAELPYAGRYAEAFLRLNISTAADLLRHLPMRYEQLRAEQTIDEAYRTSSDTHNSEVNLALRGELAAIRFAQGRSGSSARGRTEATLEDGTGTIRLVWFNAPWMRKKMHPGTKLLVQGKAKRKGDYLEMVNPNATVVDESTDRPTVEARLQPVYPATEDLPSKTIERIIHHSLDALVSQIEDHLPPPYREARTLPLLADAYRMAHRPADEDEIKAAHRRLAFDELLLLQLGVAMRKHALQGSGQALKIDISAALHQRILNRLPFTLTPAQSEAITDITADLARPVPMNRLLQGDVGSGKTAVAVYAMLAVAAKKHQSALLAPTELLAEQHFASISAMLAGSKLSLALLTSALNARDRRDLLSRLAQGTIDIVVGTHALLAESVRFHSLALAVIDEQHRFGVEQRATLRNSTPGSSSADRLHPHTLVMTATPIPRTLSLTVFGDLDVSTIKGLPPGRSPIHTRVLPGNRSHEAYTYVADRLHRGDQAFIVVPTIGDDSPPDRPAPADTASELKSVTAHAAFLAKGPFKDIKIATLHGRMPAEERQRIMESFRRGEFSALIATTVIEVGVDIPRANLIIIEHAERFGLAQLHQLRGRIGRGTTGPTSSGGGGAASSGGGGPHVCVLIADPSTPSAVSRLEVIQRSTDGFEIAEKDLEIRGPGELFGSRQSGLAPFRSVEFPRDLDLLNLARHDAFDWIGRSPHLGDPAEKLLRQRLMKLHGAGLGLGDVG